MEYKDYYKVLGVPKTATAKEIKSAYRRLARQYHPDVNKQDPNAEARFKEVNEAHEVLGDPEKRTKYDQLGANWQAYEQWQRAGGQGDMPFDLGSIFGQSGRGRAGAGPRGTRMNAEDLDDLFGGGSDFFRTFFGGDFGAAGPGPRGRRGGVTMTQDGADVEHEVEITLQEAFEGATRIVQLTNPDGTQRRLEIKLPAGIGDGKTISYAGQGGQGAYGGQAGNLIIRVRVAPDPTFTRTGDDLSVKVTAPLTTCMLGGEVEVPTFAGPRFLRIPPETADGRRFRLKGQGMPRLRRSGDSGPGERGDLIVEVHVGLPRGLSQRQRELFEELARLDQAS